MIKELKKLIIGKEDDYTIFRNNDAELVKKIKSVTIPEDTFKCWEGTSKIESETSDGQYLCKNKKGKSFIISKSEYKSYRKREKLNLINKLYPVSDYFNEHFGYYFGNKIVIVGGSSKGDYDDLGKINESTIDFKPYFDEDGSVSVRACFKSRWVGFHFCHFNEDGNYVNRDYNLNLEYHLKQEQVITKDEIIERVSATIPDVRYMYSEQKNTWFTDSFAYILDIDINEKDKDFRFSLQRVPMKENGKFGKQYTKQFAMPKRGLVDSSKSEIMERIIPVINKLKLP